MNKQIELLARQSGAAVQPGGELSFVGNTSIEKFAQLIVRECSNAVLSVPCYYKDYRSQIEEAVINDCGRAVLEHFRVEE